MIRPYARGLHSTASCAAVPAIVGSGVESGQSVAARKELYERARRLVVAELRKQNPQISAQTIRREQAALEAAVRRIEAEIQQTTAKEKTGRQGSPDSEVAEVDLRDMPRALAAMLFGTAYLAGIVAFSGVIFSTRLRKHHSLSTSARRNGSSDIFVSPVVAHRVSETADVQPRRGAPETLNPMGEWRIDRAKVVT